MLGALIVSGPIRRSHLFEDRISLCATIIRAHGIMGTDNDSSNENQHITAITVDKADTGEPIPALKRVYPTRL
jgi:hypothetical protein